MLPGSGEMQLCKIWDEISTSARHLHRARPSACATLRVMSSLLGAGRVQRIDAVLRELQTGDLKLRVRALEVERASRRSSILQV